MLATFVIGLREGLEASLIVGIVAAFLRRQGRLDLVRWIFAGVALAAALCSAVGVALRLVSRDLPQRQQEALETVIGLIAVAMVTYMVVWMRRNSRQLKGHLEQATTSALASGSGWALVVMAFVAVLREGFETAVFLLAALNETQDGGFALAGAVLGVAVAIALGYGMYRGGVRINLSKFFRATGIVLVLVAAGLVASAAHTAHEAGWLDIGQQRVLDLSSVVGPGTVQGALITGMLGIQPRPVLAEVVAWLAYLLVLGPYVAWPPGRGIERRRASRLAAAAGMLATAAAAVLVTAAPAVAAGTPSSRLDGVTARLVSGTSSGPVRIQLSGAGGDAVPAGVYTLPRVGTARVSGVAVDVYAVTRRSTGTTGSLTRAQVAEQNGGRLPIGIRPGDSDIAVGRTDLTTTTAWVEPVTGRVLKLQQVSAVTTVAQLAGGPVPLSVVRQDGGRTSAGSVATQAARARRDLDAVEGRQLMRGVAGVALALGLILLVAAGVLWLRRPGSPRQPGPASAVATPPVHAPV